jgi:uncharacterized protein (UPF0261 family)
MTILLIGTLDTKGREIAYCRDNIRALGSDAIVLDSGILGEPLDIALGPNDITRAQCAIAAGATIEQLRAAGTRGAAVEKMREGVRSVTVQLYEQEKIHGVLCLGGAEGAVLGSYAMRALPVGVPKVIVTPIASGRRHYGQLMGTKDIFVVHSVIDILGINPISRAVFDNACGAVVGMADSRLRMADSPDTALPSAIGYQPSAKYVAITMLGNTTRAVMNIKSILEQHGYEAIIFHSNGVGGPAMEEFAAQGMFVGVIDFTTDELSDQLIGGFHAGGEARLEKIGALGIPQVVVPGCIDFTVHGRKEEVPEKFKGRPAYYHNPEFTLIRLNKDEQVQIARIMAGKLNGAQGPVMVIVPTQGLSIPNTPGGVFWDPEADAAFVNELRDNLREEIPCLAVDAHINDPAFSRLVAEEFLKLMGEREIGD